MFDEQNAMQMQAVPEMQSLPDIPDLSGMREERPEPWENGWYSATIVETRSYTKDGVTKTFTSEDVVSNNGDSRNIKVQLAVKRKSDGRAMQTHDLINYRLSDFSQESFAAVLAHKQLMKDARAAGTDAPEWGSLFRTFSALSGIGTLQRIAGVRQFQRAATGGLDISPLFGKTCFVRLTDDDKGKFKEVAEISDTAPKKAPIL